MINRVDIKNNKYKLFINAYNKLLTRTCSMHTIEVVSSMLLTISTFIQEGSRQAASEKCRL